ncbi:MAG: Crp/Fnr family transcriptional regulator [Clostridiales bacterium]|nr:Crp/Fnr family transcriptional regulator [Clostridiales bacterium]
MTEEKLKPEYARLLKQSFLLTQAGGEMVEQLLAKDWRSLSFSKGDTISGRGINQDNLGLIVRGRASAKSGGTLILRGFGKGDVFGAAALFAPDGEPLSEIVAESSGEVLLLPLETVRNLLKSQPRSAENYIRFLSQRIEFLTRKIEALGSGEAVNRLAAHLITSCQPDMLGRPACRATVSRLAQSLGISRASVYRALEQLAETGCLHREGKTVVIDSLELLASYK